MGDSQPEERGMMGRETGGQRWPDFPSRDGANCFLMEQA